jgi:ferredoxin-NADP reductase
MPPDASPATEAAASAPPRGTLRVAPLAHLRWREARLASSVNETPDARTLVLDVTGWPGHTAGQHVDVRLTAPDGYQATRSYSLSSGPGEPPTLTVQVVEGGEVSTYLVRDFAVGDTLELRGPIGGYFVWTGSHRPLLLVGGGSGLAPLRAMWRAADQTAPLVVVASVTTPARLLYAGELAERVRAGSASATVHLTRAGVPTEESLAGTPLGEVTSTAGRVGMATIAGALAACGGAEADPGVFVCGPTMFVESMIDLLEGAGLDPRSVRAERFG